MWEEEKRSEGNVRGGNRRGDKIRRWEGERRKGRKGKENELKII